MPLGILGKEILLLDGFSAGTEKDEIINSNNWPWAVLIDKSNMLSLDYWSLINSYWNTIRLNKSPCRNSIKLSVKRHLLIENSCSSQILDVRPLWRPNVLEPNPSIIHRKFIKCQKSNEYDSGRTYRAHLDTNGGNILYTMRFDRAKSPTLIL